MKSIDRILGVITPVKAERLLCDLANIPDLAPIGTVNGAIYVVKDRQLAREEVGPQRPGEIVPGEGFQHATWIKSMKKRYPETFGNCSEHAMHTLKHLLRAVWEGSDLRRREWFCFLARKLHADCERHAQTDRDKLVGDARIKKDELEFFLEEKAGRPRTEMIYNLGDRDLIVAIRESELPAPNQFECAIFYLQRNLNHALRCPNPTCARPYFFAHEKGVRYCSPACAHWGQRESKKKWWSSPEGKAWQESRSKSKKKRRKQ